LKGGKYQKESHRFVGRKLKEVKTTVKKETTINIFLESMMKFQLIIVLNFLEEKSPKLMQELTKFSNKSQVFLDQVKNIFYPDTTKFSGEPIVL
jgi:hypothetical protein